MLQAVVIFFNNNNRLVHKRHCGPPPDHPGDLGCRGRPDAWGPDEVSADGVKGRAFPALDAAESDGARTPA